MILVDWVACVLMDAGYITLPLMPHLFRPVRFPPISFGMPRQGVPAMMPTRRGGSQWRGLRPARHIADTLQF